MKSDFDFPNSDTAHVATAASAVERSETSREAILDCRFQIAELSIGSPSLKERILRDEYKIYPYKDGFEIAADREALLWISEICQGLANLTDEEAKTGANHYHLDEYLGHAEPGSAPLIILYKPDL